METVVAKHNATEKPVVLMDVVELVEIVKDEQPAKMENVFVSTNALWAKETACHPPS